MRRRSIGRYWRDGRVTGLGPHCRVLLRSQLRSRIGQGSALSSGQFRTDRLGAGLRGPTLHSPLQLVADRLNRVEAGTCGADGIADAVDFLANVVEFRLADRLVELH